MLYNVGVYARLSKEDGLGHESTSIENQKKMLSQFVSFMPDWILEKVYVDDGYSGGSFHRPAFQEMISDACKGRINLVLVKDLSRFGRNYLEAGKYLQTVLPEAGCRFVSISEGIDTSKGETDVIDFMNFMNDYYLKNLSGKIKSVLTAKAKKGEFLMGREPYGYRRNETDSHKLVIDNPAAEIVKKIFNLRLKNLGYAKIAGELNREGILPPLAYANARKGKQDSGGGLNLWRDRTVKLILQNEVYIGNMIQHKYGTYSHRSKKVIKKDSDQWIRVENTHEPIIDMNTWNRVQAIDLKSTDPKEARPAQASLFSEVLYCSDCKRPMRPNQQKEVRKSGKIVRYTSYLCTTHMQTGRVKCSRHSIFEISLKRIVLNEIKHLASGIVQDEKHIVDMLKKKLSCQNKEKLSEMKIELKSLERRIRELENMTPRLYEDKIGGVISTETFNNLITQNEYEKKALVVKKNEILTSLDDTQKKMNDINLWISLIREKSSQDFVDRDFIREIIDKIEIGEATITDGTKYQSITIFYKFVGNVEWS